MTLEKNIEVLSKFKMIKIYEARNVVRILVIKVKCYQTFSLKILYEFVMVICSFHDFIITV